jgi:hypothetical protein
VSIYVHTASKSGRGTPGDICHSFEGGEGGMATKTPEDGEYKVGDQIIVKLDERRKVHATIRAVYQEDEVKY